MVSDNHLDGKAAQNQSHSANGHLAEGTLATPVDSALVVSTKPTMVWPSWDEAELPPPLEAPSSETQSLALVAAEKSLGGLQPNLSEQMLKQWITAEFFTPLLIQRDFSMDELMAAIELLRGQLKKLGYRPGTATKYLTLWKAQTRLKLADDRAQTNELTLDAIANGTYPPRFKAIKIAGSAMTQLLSATDSRADLSCREFDTEGIYDISTLKLLSNFTIEFHEEMEIVDDRDSSKCFQGMLKLFGKELPFKIDAADYADNKRLKAKIHEVGGIGAIVYVSMDRLREAISTLNLRPGQSIRKTRVTSDLGWQPDGESYLVPAGCIRATGLDADPDDAEVRVDLTHEELARHLNLKPIADPNKLRQVKEHIIKDLRKLNVEGVTNSLLAACGVAVLKHFAPDTNPVALWLVGLTGAGKSFLAKLFMNFFGNFPPAGGKFASWSGTANYLQRQGHYFKDALYLIDDYKPETIQSHMSAVRLLQNYADDTGRQRLKSDATTNTSRSIRGFLLSTGEDVPEHTASALARCIIVEVPQQEKEADRAKRCLEECKHYSGVMLDFITWLLKRQRTKAFQKMVDSLQRRYYAEIAGQQNDSRIAVSSNRSGHSFESPWAAFCAGSMVGRRCPWAPKLRAQ